MDFEEYTIIIPAYHYPLAEICVTLIRYFHPDIKIIISFDSDFHVQERKDFFSKIKNIEIIPDRFKQNHSNQLDRMINSYVDTKYFFCLDDDSFIINPYILESINEIINRSQYKGALFIERFSINNAPQRIIPCFFIFETDLFKKHNMSFMTSYNYVIDGNKKKYYYYDVGAFVLYDIFKYKIPMLYLNENIHQCIRHLSYISHLYQYVDTKIFKNHNFNDSLFSVNSKHFDLTNLTSKNFTVAPNPTQYRSILRSKIDKINVFTKIANEIISEKISYPKNYNPLFSNWSKQKTISMILNTSDVPIKFSKSFSKI